MKEFSNCVKNPNNMNWLKKVIAQLQSDWWRKAQYHISKTIENMFNPIPKGWPYSGSEIVYLPRERGPLAGFEFRGNETSFDFPLFRNEKIYECKIVLTFDKDMKNFLKYDGTNPYVYRTDRVTGIENANANLFGMSCVVYRRRLQERFQDRVEIGTVDLVLQEASPYYALESIKSIIMSDFDGENDEENTGPAPLDSDFVPTDGLKVSNF